MNNKGIIVHWCLCFWEKNRKRTFYDLPLYKFDKPLFICI